MSSCAQIKKKITWLLLLVVVVVVEKEDIFEISFGSTTAQTADI